MFNLLEALIGKFKWQISGVEHYLSSELKYLIYQIFDVFY